MIHSFFYAVIAENCQFGLPVVREITGFGVARGPGH